MSARFERRLRTRQITTPAGTAAAPGQSTTWTIGPGILETLVVIIPDGHVGLTGIAVAYSGQRVIPFHSTEWVIGNDRTVTIRPNLGSMNGRLTVVTYNTDVFSHSHYLEATVRDFEVVEEGGLPELGGVALPEPVAPGEPGEWPSDWPDDVVALFIAEGLTPDEAMSLLDDILAQAQENGAKLDELLFYVAEAPGGPAPFPDIPEPPEFPPFPGEPPIEPPPPAPEPQVRVPNVIGLRWESARDAIKTAGLDPERDNVNCSRPQGRVCNQNPNGGAMVKPGRKITVKVSR